MSRSSRLFTYYDTDIIQTGALITTIELGANVHAHIFIHNFADRPHAHVVTINSVNDSYVARSLTVERYCDCGRGNYDCGCSSIEGRHMHAFVHQHKYDASGNHTHPLQLRTPSLALPPA